MAGMSGNNDCVFSPDRILVDGSSFLFRAYHASAKSNLRNSDGKPIGAVMGVANMLGSIKKEFPDVPACVVFDAHGKNFRHEIYPEYKANRKAAPDDLVAQIEEVQTLVPLLGFQLVIVGGVEADDVLGTYAAEAEKNNLKLLIMTGDKDLYQLVSPNVVLRDTMKGTSYDEKSGEEHFGIKPSGMVTYLSLLGDSSDNIPGMQGCGEKSAAALVNAFGDLAGIESHLEECRNLDFRGAKKFPESFLEQIETIKLSYRLASIKTDVDVPVKLADMKCQNRRLAELVEAYSRIGLRQLRAKAQAELTVQNSQASLGGDLFSSAGDVQELDAENVSSSESSTGSRTLNVSAKIMLNEEMMADAVKACRTAGKVAVAFIQNDPSDIRSDIIGFAFGYSQSSMNYVRFGQDMLSELPDDAAMKYVAELLNDGTIETIAHDVKREARFFRKFGISLTGKISDTMLMAYVLDPSDPHYSVDDLAAHELLVQPQLFESLVGKGRNKILPRDAEPAKTAAYICEKAALALLLAEHLPKAMTEDQSELYSRKVIPLMKVLVRMESHGVLIDPAKLQELSCVFEDEMQSLSKSIEEIAGHHFNISSPKQVAEVLFVEQGMVPSDPKWAKKIEKGDYSTKEEILLDLSDNYELPRMILDYRAVSKLKNTYSDVLPRLADRSSWRVSCSFNQTGTVTGRLSSSDPNLQNIPVRTKAGRQIRSAFVAGEGRTIIAADYSQIELRVLAHLSGDRALIESFRAGEDIHRRTAAEIMGKLPEEVSAEERRSAKAVNFGLIYGMSAFGLAKQLGIARGTAKNYMDAYFARYPDIGRYLKDVVDSAKRDGFVTTVCGRHIPIPGINSSNAIAAKASERQATNAPMQGSSADIITNAMLAIDEEISKNWAPGDIKMVLQVHDELVFDVRSELEAEAKDMIMRIMPRAYDLAVPLEVGVGIAKNWELAH